MPDAAAIVGLLRDTLQEAALVCIDGPAGAGKTTLAASLVEAFPGAHVVHLDDLYNGWDNALDDDLTERLVRCIRDPLLRGEPIRYQRYDWYEGRFDEHIDVGVSTLLILEGVGAAQREMRSHAALSVFIDIEPELGRARVIERDGALSVDHIDAWQREEQRHFEADDTRAGVTLHIPGA